MSKAERIRTLNDRLRSANDWCSGAGTCVSICEEAAGTIDALASRWQPIETAPHDEPVLLWLGHGYNQIVLATYDTSVKGWTTERFLNDELDEPAALDERAPTHWMPLPEGPEVK